HPVIVPEVRVTNRYPILQLRHFRDEALERRKEIDAVKLLGRDRRTDLSMSQFILESMPVQPRIHRYYNRAEPCYGQQGYEPRLAVRQIDSNTITRFDAKLRQCRGKRNAVAEYPAVGSRSTPASYECPVSVLLCTAVEHPIEGPGVCHQSPECTGANLEKYRNCRATESSGPVSFTGCQTGTLLSAVQPRLNAPASATPPLPSESPASAACRPTPHRK